MALGYSGDHFPREGMADLIAGGFVWKIPGGSKTVFMLSNMGFEVVTAICERTRK